MNTFSADEHFVAMLYTVAGGGKTSNSVRVNVGERGKNIILCSDNSDKVLGNYDLPYVDKQKITHCVKSKTVANDSTYFTAQFNAVAESNKYDNIIVDNISDLFDMWIIELDEQGISKDKRQDYQYVYTQLKRLVRKATMCNCNVIFTAWTEQVSLVDPEGHPYVNVHPKLPNKILDNICGLCNVVGYVAHSNDKNGNPVWYYITKPTKEYYAKDQLYNRQVIKPELLFTRPEEVKK